MTSVHLPLGLLQTIRRAFNFACLFLIVVLAGCTQNDRLKKLAAEDETYAKQYVDLLRQQKFDDIEHDADPGIFPLDGHETLVSMAAMFPTGQPLSVKSVGINTFQGEGFYRSSITLEYEFPRQWVLANVSTREIGGTTWITGFQIQQIPDSVENTNRFTLANKGVSQYAVFLLALSSLSISLCAFVVCIRTKIRKRKWLWLILVLLGVGRIVVNWTTGQSSFNFLWLSIIPGGANGSIYGPWFIYASVPMGAIIFLVKRKQLLRPQDAEAG